MAQLRLTENELRNIIKKVIIESFTNKKEFYSDDVRKSITENDITIYDQNGNKLDSYSDNGLAVNNPSGRPLNGVRGSQLSQQEQFNLYKKFKDSYEASTGISWGIDKFISRLQDWTLYGDSNGFVSVRIQRSGLFKLTGAAGSPRSILKGLSMLKNTGAPIWGLVTYDIAKMMVKQGFKAPDKQITTALIRYIPSNVFGDTAITVNQNGTLAVRAKDTGTTDKIFVGNDAYFKFLVSQVGSILPPQIQNVLTQPNKMLSLDV